MLIILLFQSTYYLLGKGWHRISPLPKMRRIHLRPSLNTSPRNFSKKTPRSFEHFVWHERLVCYFFRTAWRRTVYLVGNLISHFHNLLQVTNLHLQTKRNTEIL